MPILCTNLSEKNLEKAIQAMKDKYPYVKIGSLITSLKYTPLQSNIPPSQIAAKKIITPR